MHINTSKSENEIVVSAISKGIKLVPLSRYFHDITDTSSDTYKSTNTYVMNYSSIKLDNLDDIVNALYVTVAP